MAEGGDDTGLNERPNDRQASRQFRCNGHHAKMTFCDFPDFFKNFTRWRADTFGLYHAPLVQRDERAFEMNAEQMRSAEVPPGALGGQCKVPVVPAGFEYGCGQKAGGSEASAGSRYGLQGLGCAVEYIGTAGALDMDVDKTRGNYLALCVENVVADRFRFGLADLHDDAVFKENGRGLPVLTSVK